MKDTLQDIIHHTIPLGVIELIKITGTDSETVMHANAEDRTVIMSGKFVNPVDGFQGVFGMPNLGKLKTILGFDDEYGENATISVTARDRDGVSQPESIHFENKSGDFVNDYRLMSKALIEEKVKNVVFKGATWNVEFAPEIPGIQRLKKQASVHTEETVFATAMSGSAIQIQFGDPATHSGNFVFHANPKGSTTKRLMWPVRQFMSIMDLSGDKRVFISDQGVMRITVDSGIAQYEYLLPAQQR